MRKFLYIFVVLLLCGCHDDYWDLGDSYLYSDGCVYKYIDEKGGPMATLIPYDVLNFSFDKNYIIAYQKPDSAIYRNYYINIFRESSDSTIRSQEIADSLEILLGRMLSIRDCYWIIRKKDVKVYGPMRELDFNRQCKKMNIKFRWIRNMSQHDISMQFH